MLNFWATYCIPCREEIPALNSLQHELEAEGLRIVRLRSTTASRASTRISRTSSSLITRSCSAAVMPK